MATAPTAEVTASSAVPARPRADVLRRADGIELIGEFEDSGFKEPPNLARRADGQVVQLSELLYAVAAAADGARGHEDIAAIASERTGRPVNAGNVQHIADKKLRPLGVLTLADGSTPELEKREPPMSLSHRRPLLPERAVNVIARPFMWLHLPLVVLIVITAIALFDAWLFGIHGIAGGLYSVIYSPEKLLALLGSVVLATIFHEFGHASACRYGGARPGVMGVGLYLVWPAFYCDVTDAYRLNRMGRLRTDLGGVYFNLIFALLAGGLYFATGEEAALLAAAVMHIIVFQQLLPLLRFDGYYVLTDLTGVPDILSRIRPIFRSLVPGRKQDPQVAELKPWVRFVVTAYLVLLVPVLAVLFAWIVIGLPRLLATVHDSFGMHVDRIVDAAGFAEAAVGAFRCAILVLPVAATFLSITRATRAVGRGLIAWSSDSAPRRTVAAAIAVAVVGAVGYVWWPNGDYQPIRAGERGTLGEMLRSMDDMPGGRPSFTPEREALYGPVATEREADDERRARTRGERPAGDRDPSRRTQPESGASPSAGWGTETGGGYAEDDESSWPRDLDESDTGEAIGGDGSSPDQPGTTTQPAPAPSPSPAPTDSGGTTTETTPPPTSTDETTPTEPAPTTTETTPPPTETAPVEPSPDASTESTTPLPDEGITTAPDTTTTAPDPTTSPIP